MKAIIFMLYIRLQWVKPLNNAMLASVFPRYNRRIPFILATSAQYEPKFKRKINFLTTFFNDDNGL